MAKFKPYGMGMKIDITTQDGVVETRRSVSSESEKPLAQLKQNKWPIWCAGAVLCILIIGLGVGLGLGLTRSKWDSHSSNPDPTANPTDVLPSSILSLEVSSSTSTASSASSASSTTSANHWQPTAGTKFQIVLLEPPKNESVNAAVYDIDLFDNSATKITKLHKLSRKVICYFSAGSFENWRSDAKSFTTSDYGLALDGWAGEYWLNTNSDNVRKVMAARLDLAVTKGCDGVDPDNVNGYENETGFNLTEANSINYIKYLADEAHARGLAIGLKNAGAIVDEVIDKMDWDINESCVQYDECDLYVPFISQNKPVFHIEYPEESKMKITTICSAKNTTKFSTVIKTLELDDWAEYCP